MFEEVLSKLNQVDKIVDNLAGNNRVLPLSIPSLKLKTIKNDSSNKDSKTHIQLEKGDPLKPANDPETKPTLPAEESTAIFVENKAISKPLAKQAENASSKEDVRTQKQIKKQIKGSASPKKIKSRKNTISDNPRKGRPGTVRKIKVHEATVDTVVKTNSVENNEDVMKGNSLGNEVSILDQQTKMKSFFRNSQEEYMWVPSCSKFMATPGSAFLYNNEEFSSEQNIYPKIGQEVKVENIIYKIKALEDECLTIELDKPFKGKASGSGIKGSLSAYDGKIGIFYKCYLNEMTNAQINWCRFKGSGRVFNDGVKSILSLPKKIQAKEIRKMKLEDTLALLLRDEEKAIKDNHSKVERLKNSTIKRLRSWQKKKVKPVIVEDERKKANTQEVQDESKRKVKACVKECVVRIRQHKSKKDEQLSLQTPPILPPIKSNSRIEENNFRRKTMERLKQARQQKERLKNLEKLDLEKKISAKQKNKELREINNLDVLERERKVRMESVRRRNRWAREESRRKEEDRKEYNRKLEKATRKTRRRTRQILPIQKTETIDESCSYAITSYNSNQFDHESSNHFYNNNEAEVTFSVVDVS